MIPRYHRLRHAYLFHLMLLRSKPHNPIVKMLAGWTKCASFSPFHSWFLLERDGTPISTLAHIGVLSSSLDDDVVALNEVDLFEQDACKGVDATAAQPSTQLQRSRLRWEVRSEASKRNDLVQS